MKLFLAVEGVCAGHLCDNCPTCRRGHCCRRDNPDYKLPQLGEWDGPLWGELGRLENDGDRVQCHCCGKWYKILGMHTLFAHDVTSDEYRALFGLNATTPLASAEVSQRYAVLHSDRLEKMREQRGLVSPFHTMTAEQRSAHQTGRHPRLETQRNPEIAARRLEAIRRPEVRQTLSESRHNRAQGVPCKCGCGGRIFKYRNSPTGAYLPEHQRHKKYLPGHKPDSFWEKVRAFLVTPQNNHRVALHFGLDHVSAGRTLSDMMKHGDLRRLAPTIYVSAAHADDQDWSGIIEELRQESKDLASRQRAEARFRIHDQR